MIPPNSSPNSSPFSHLLRRGSVIATSRDSKIPYRVMNRLFWTNHTPAQPWYPLSKPHGATSLMFVSVFVARTNFVHFQTSWPVEILLCRVVSSARHLAPTFCNRASLIQQSAYIVTSFHLLLATTLAKPLTRLQPSEKSLYISFPKTQLITSRLSISISNTFPKRSTVYHPESILSITIRSSLHGPEPFI